MERHMRLSRAAVVLVTIALIASIAAAVWFASPDAPYVPSEDSGAALGTAAPAEDGTVAEGYTPSGTGISDNGTDNSAITTIRNSLASNKSYHLTDNITVTSFHTPTDWSEKDTFGSATLDGAGHTITIDAKSTGSYSDVGGLFVGLRDGAVIKNLTIKVTGFSFGVSGNTLNAGIIAGYASGTNITIQNVKVILDYDTKNSSNSGQDNYAYNTNQADAITIRLGGLVGKVEKGTTTVKNVTVHNSAGGTYGFSAQSWTTNPTGVFASDSTSQLSVGGFVGDVMDSGVLDADQITYSTDGTGKISAVGESSSGKRSNQGLVGGVVGYLSNGSVDISGLVIDVPGARDTLFTGHNMNTTNSRGFVVGHKNSAPKLSMSGIIVNDKSGIGNGAVDYDEYLVGSDGAWSGRVTYPSNVVEAVRFSSDGTPMFAIAKKAPTDATGIVAEIYQHQISIADPAESVDITNWTESGLTSQFVAQDESEGGQLVWITLPKLTTTGSNDYELLVKYSTSSTYSVVTDSAGSITSVDGTTYNGTKVYDGKALTAPYISYGSKTVNAWAAESDDLTNVNGGEAKVFSYNESALNGHTTVVYNGTTYFIDGGTIYSPGNINVGGASQTVTLGNAFSYTVTKATPVVTVDKITHPYFEGEEMPTLTASSIEPAGLPGEFSWIDTELVAGTNGEYDWTWTPTDTGNYNSVNGTVIIETVNERRYDRIEVTLSKTEYTAYEVLDKGGLKVTAYYEGETEGVDITANTEKYNVEYSGNGTEDRLEAGTGTVKVTLLTDDTKYDEVAITVSKLAVDVPIANQGLVYNGEVQTGVEASVEGYYSLTNNNTGTNAADYIATAMLTDPDNTEWSTGGTDNVTIPWSIDPMTLDGTVLAAGSLEYDGKEKEAAFDLTTGTLFDPDQVTIVYGGVADRTNVTGEAFTATAQLPNNGNYKWAADAPSASFTVTPKPVVIGVTGDLSKTYDGQAVDPDTLFTPPNGVNDEGALQLAFVITVDGENRDEILNAGSYTVTAVLADGQTNYTAQSAQARYEIAKVVLTGTLTFDDTATYDGTAKTATFILTSDNLVGQDSVGEVTYNEVDRINVTGQAIVASVALPSSGNYQWQDGIEPTASLTIVKATPGVTVKLSDDMPGNLTVAATLDNDWLVRTDNTGVEGTLAWDKAGELLQQGEVEYGWTFVPTDSNNYNNETGFLSITASEDTLQSITVKDGTYRTEYTAYEDFDPTGLVVIAHYASGADVEVTSGFTFEHDKALTDGQITVTLNGVPTTITVTVNKREIPLPAATEGLIFNGKEQNGIDQKWIEQYAKFVKVEGNSQRDAGDYRATVTLTKNTKYVTWKGGSTDAQTIDWSIAYVTIEVTVNAESKTVEYGTAYSWNPNDFFAVEVTNSDLFEVKLGVFDDDSITNISTANVGEYSEGIFASVTRKDGGALEEQDLASFKFSQDIKQLVMKVIVTAKAVAKPVVDPTVFDATGETITLPIAESEYYNIYGNTAIEPGRYVATIELKDAVNTMWADGTTDDVSIAWTISEPVTSDEVIADILAMEKVTWQNAEEFLDLEARYDALDKSEQTADATAKLEVLRAQYDALRNAAFDDIEAAHEVTAKSLGKALAAAAAGLSAAAIALAIAKRRSI